MRIKSLSINLTPRRSWFVAAALVLLAGSAQAQYDPDWTRNFRVGMLVGFNIKTEFRMGGTIDFNGNRPGEAGNADQDHIYDDGYVRVDRTGNADPGTGPQSAFWGYDSPSQFDAGSQTLNFTGTTAFSTTGSTITKDESPFLGLDMAYGGCIWRGERIRVGWELGFGLMSVEATDSRTLPANVTQVTHSFSTAGIVVPGLDGSGYHADSDAIGPTIGATPTEVGVNNVAGTNSGSRTLDVMVYAFRVGPTLFWDATDRIGLQVSAGPALGFISGDYRFDDVIQTPTGNARNRGSIGMNEVVFGGFINATVTFHAVMNGDFYLSAQYMPLGTSTVSGGGREARLDLQGAVYFAAGVNWPF